MRAHEVPTHVQAEDRVLLGLTFPQIVAMSAVCAIAYGAYRTVPIGPSEARLALAAVLGLAGVVTIVGRIGGRRLPLVAADLLRFALGPRRYAGTPAELARNQPPAPMRSGPGPLRLLARRTRRGLRRLRRRRNRERGNGRMRLRPRAWFGRGRRRRNEENANGARPPRREAKRRKTLLAVLMATGLAAAATVSQAALADEHRPIDEIEFEIPEPIPGRRLFIEGFAVSGDQAEVTLRAATALSLRVQAYGGPGGRTLRYWGSKRLGEGERTMFSLPLSGDAPSLTFSWRDRFSQAGALTLKDEQLPYPLPSMDGELCDIRVTSLGWSAGAIEGTLVSTCVSAAEARVDLPVAEGHHSQTVTALLDAEVTAVTGTVTVTAGGAQTSAPLVPDGATTFRVPFTQGPGVHVVTIDAAPVAALEAAAPPLVRLTHQPARTEEHTRTVVVERPGVSRTIRETVTVIHDDGTTTEHEISARLSIPSATFERDVVVRVSHAEHVRAEVVERAAIRTSRDETVSLALGIGADAPYQPLVVPEPEEAPSAAEQTPLTEAETSALFALFGWEQP